LATTRDLAAFPRLAARPCGTIQRSERRPWREERQAPGVQREKQRTRISTGNPYEVSVGYSRAVSVGNHVYVSGTTALMCDGTLVGEGDPYAQTKQTLDTIQWALEQAGSTLDDIVRYRVYLTRIEDTPEVSRALAERFQAIRPANTLLAVAALADPRMLVEIDADAVIGSASPVEDSR
jgi:enamine deaminase RidA (YjgF/YER057c/UK114 family)